MISLLKYIDCPTCGHKHHFGLPEGQWPVGSECEYVCPETGRRSKLRLDGPTEKARYYPQGAVQLTPQAAKTS